MLDRRDFAARALGAGGWLALHSWLESCSGEDSSPSSRAASAHTTSAAWSRTDLGEARRAALRKAARRAGAEGKPLLVLLLREATGIWGGGDRGAWFGGWIERGGVEQHFAFAQCVPIAATNEDLWGLTGGPAIPTSAWMCLVDTRMYDDAAPTVLNSLPLAFAPLLASETFDAPASAELERLTGVLRKGLEDFDRRVMDLASSVDARLAREERQALASWIEGGAAPEDRLLVRSTAFLLRTARNVGPDRRSAIRGALDAAIVRTFVEQDLDGALWARPNGCGFELTSPRTEEERMLGAFVCGMGLVPEKAARFLHLYARP